ncbi:MAG: RNA polymerase factor sigma-54 [Shimia sp.]|uniref:RNA polymerase factor sigma-54 n=1 Tax=Shimia sp. TaxID=1954381 RepID=UPI001B2E7D47|nr:RNA polymerase factor sigma-54 [Shimia sp.]MBO6898109.1 RNA polymerase factor sigma-54 [Shimia sp.]
MFQVSMQAQLAQRQSLVFTPQLQQAIKLLLLNNISLASYVEKAAEENPFLEVKLPEVPHGAPMAPIASGGAREQTDYDPIAMLVDRSGDTFGAQVFAQVEDLLRDHEERAIGYALASHLEPTGWLLVALEDVAANLAVDVRQVEHVLRKLQRAEPAGLFARNLRECLRLQLRGCGEDSAKMHVLIDHLDLVQHRAMPELRRKLDCSKEQLAGYLRLLRGLNPKPGLDLGGGYAAPLREPDLCAFKDGDGEWSVELNNSTLPVIKVNEQLGRKVRKLIGKDADREFVRSSLRTAKWLTRAILQRNETSIKVAAEIVRYQKPFLDEGMQQMRPLKLKMIANAVGVHESTISRVTSSLTMQTPQGCFPLKAFFSATIDSDGSDEGASAAAIRNKIRNMVAAEPRDRPFSDDKITNALNSQGFKIARRTVAKYRKLDRIPSSSQRHRSYEMAQPRAQP